MAAPGPFNLSTKDIIGAIVTAIVIWVVLKFALKVSNEEAMGGAVMVLVGGLIAPIVGDVLNKQLKLEKVPA